MNDLIVRNVVFNGTLLRAAKDDNGDIWAGVRWICDGIGMNKNMRDRQIKNIQADIVLSKGAAYLTLPTNGGKQSVLCLQLNYVPLWLAKISITPTMQRESPELVDRLIEYQLKAKDVLANAFLSRHKSHDNGKEIMALRNDMEKRFQELNDSMGRAFQILMNSRINGSVDNLAEFHRWEHKIDDAASIISQRNYHFHNKKSVMIAALKKMRDVYGYVHAQAEKEWLNGMEDVDKPSTLYLIYQDPVYRDILSSILGSMMESSSKREDSRQLDDVIEPLVIALNECSPHHCSLYRKIFLKMEEDGMVCWKNRITRYQKEHQTTAVPNKKTIIAENRILFRKFQQIVNEMLDGIAKK